MTFFNPDTEDLDPATIRTHAVRLAKAGLVGLVTMGSNGEDVHLSRAERQTVICETRTALTEAGFANAPVITGASEQSIRGTIELCRESRQCRHRVLPDCTAQLLPHCCKCRRRPLRLFHCSCRRLAHPTNHL